MSDLNAEEQLNKIPKIVKNPKKGAKQGCKDKNCPFHGNLKCRGRIFSGIVISTKMNKTLVVEMPGIEYIKKYERYGKKRTRIKAHNPDCLNAKEGDIVKISECKPLSKTKHFVVTNIIGKEAGFKEKMEALEEGKYKERKKEEKNRKEREKDESNKGEDN